jgi:VWFA-related protein
MRFALLALLAATTLLAQTPRYREEVTVAEVTLEVTVTDEEGNAVSGLTAADFEVLEDGKPVKVTFAREVRPASAAPSATGQTPEASAAGAEPRTLAIFIDNADIGENARHLLFEGLRSAAAEVKQSGGDVFLFLWTGRLQAVKPKELEAVLGYLTKFETDEELRAAAKARAQSRTMTSRTTPELVFQVERAESIKLLGALDAAAQIVGNLPGRRIMLFASRGFQFPKPTANDVRATMQVVSGSLGGATLPETLFAPEMAIHTGREAATVTAVDQAAAAIANRRGFPVYGLFTGGLGATALESGVRTGGIPEAFALTPSLTSDPAGSIADLAYKTGGRSFGAGSNFGPFLETVTRDLNHFYTIAYRSSAELRFRKLEVRVNRREWTVRHREAAVPNVEGAPGRR